MGLKVTLLGLVLATFCWHYGDGTFLCLMPKSFHAGWPFGISITLRKVTRNEPVAFQATVVKKHVSSELTEGPVTSGSIEMNTGETKLLTLQIPHKVPALADGEDYFLHLESSGGLVDKSQQILSFNKSQSVLLVQSDKNIYKPGQTVLFRILNMNKNLQPMFQPLSVFIVNPNGNKLDRFDNLKSSTGVIETSFELSDYATLGTWQIQVIDKNMELLHASSFLVEEFVLPKFSVEVSFSPNFLVWNVYTPLPTIMVKSVYTYGKPVQGKCKVTLSRPGSSSAAQPLVQTIEDGVLEISNEIDWKSLVGSQPATSKSVLAQVEVEDETGRKERGSATIVIHRSNIKLEVLDSSTKVLRQRIRAEFHIKVCDHSGTPIPDKQIQATISISAFSHRLKDVVIQTSSVANQPYITVSYTPTDLDKLGEYIPTATLKVDLVEDYMVSVTKKLAVYKAEGNGAIKVKRDGNRVAVIKKGEQVEFSIESNINTAPTTLSYMVISQGNILEAGNIINQKITLTPTLEMCPQAFLVVHMIQSLDKTDEVVTDYISLAPHLCLDKRVMVSFAAQQVRTGAETNMDIKVERRDAASPDVWTDGGIHDVYYLAVDKSIVLLQGDTDLTENKVLSSLGALGVFSEYKNNNVHSAGTTFSHLGLHHMEGQLLVFDASTEMRPEPEMIAMAGNAGGRQPAAQSNAVEKDDESENKVKGEEETSTNVIRKDFPDTWLWGRAETQSNGQVSKLVRLPDTITSWHVSAFAVNSEGVAYAGSPAELTGYQPFFLSMNLPYSIKRGEIFKLRITVFNYRGDDVAAKVRLRLSEMFTVMNGTKKDGWSEADLNIKPNLASSVVFQINASSIGEIELEAVAEDKTDGQRDQVVRKLLVKPEGEERMEAITYVMVLNKDGPLTKIFQIDWPYDEIVADSQRLQVKITGEILGQALDGLENLVTMPTGCGEQNMITTVPNIYGLMYIKSTNQMNMEETVEKLTKNMKRGYQREVEQFKHDNGSYSAWGGKSGDKGSTWLTAFVIKSFAQAARYMSVETDVLGEGKKFILSKQSRNGAFREDGKVLHRDLQTGTGEGLGMTVYVLLSMLEMQDALGMKDLDTQIQLATSYIVSKVGEMSDMDNFLSAMTAYTLSLLPSRNSNVEETIEDLIARVQDSDEEWNQQEELERKSTLTSGIAPRPKNLQTAAYMLLTYIRLDKNWEALNIMKWIQSKQNAKGGFISTQDTVLVLQSLAEFGRYMGEAKKSGMVTVTVPGTNMEEEVDISGDRSILLQIVDLPASTEKINVTLTGQLKAMAVVKVAYYYYTLVEDDSETTEKTFTNSVDLRTRSYQLGNNMHRVQTCMKSSLEEAAEMYLLSAHLPSGEASVYTPSELKSRNPKADRIEVEEGFIHFYVDTLTEEDLCWNFDIESDTEFVKKLSGSVKLMSYYDPEKKKEVPLSLDQSVVCTTDPCDSDSAVTLTSLFLSVVICTVISLLMCM